MRCSDGQTRDLVTTMPGAGWDYAQTRHPYHMHERPKGPHYCLYNRRHMAVCFDDHTTEDGYWRLRQKAAVLHTGEYPLQFVGPDAERLLDLLFTKDMTKAKVMRCAYGLACYDDGGLLVDGILLRLAEDRVMAVSNDMVFVGTEELGVDAGIDQLMEIALEAGEAIHVEVGPIVIGRVNGEAVFRPDATKLLLAVQYCNAGPPKDALTNTLSLIFNR